MLHGEESRLRRKRRKLPWWGNRCSAAQKPETFCSISPSYGGANAELIHSKIHFSGAQLLLITERTRVQPELQG